MFGLVGRSISSIVEVIRGLSTVFKHTFREPITLGFPEEMPELPATFRGRLALAVNPQNGEHLCISCLQCERVCPDKCIQITSHKSPETNKPELIEFKIDHGLCMFCGLCTEVCPTNCIINTNDFEMSDYTRESLVYDIRKLTLTQDESAHYYSKKELPPPKPKPPKPAAKPAAAAAKPGEEKPGVKPEVKPAAKPEGAEAKPADKPAAKPESAEAKPAAEAKSETAEAKPAAEAKTETAEAKPAAEAVGAETKEQDKESTSAKTLIDVEKPSVSADAAAAATEAGEVQKEKLAVPSEQKTTEVSDELKPSSNETESAEPGKKEGEQ